MILIDTSLIVWLMHGEDKIGARAQELIDTHHPVHYSSISTLELVIKSMLGKIHVPVDLDAILDEAGLRQLPFVGEHAHALHDLPGLNGHDLFDRALVAQAGTEGLMFLTADRRLLGLGEDWIIDATE